ncbi:Calcineurin-like phosphoesterase family protein [Leishmania donovani]|uniref:Calcineurin-like phosphoesterase family protein n=1 Tax=Leishmania donovani TaxID=5661 RepID=A0A504X6V9_LEIDO|nr:Calcineurin-like phosphoesterase family protein [Leishmania donovani]
MLRRGLWRYRRISYVTDVEGDFAYFQRFVCISRVLRWEPAEAAVSSNPPRPFAGGSNGSRVANGRWAPLSSAVLPAPSGAFPASDAAASTQALGTTTTPAVTDAYEPEYCRLVDLSRYRLGFQDATSHFVFGGDAFDHGNDITFGKALLDFKRRFPSRVHLLLGNRDVNKMAMYPRMACEVEGMAPDAAEDTVFTLTPPSMKTVRAASLTEALRPYGGASCGSSGDTLRTDAVSFLQWALQYKLGGPNAFAHRRQELREMAAMMAEGCGAVAAAPPAAGAEAMRDGIAYDEDAVVAASFFTAAQPGGVYYEYIRAGVLSVVLDGVLFVHGGVNASNAGFVPSLEATSYAEQVAVGQWWLPEVAPQEVTTTPTASSATSALGWLAALEQFKAAAFSDWSGIHTVCAGHQPVGDTPAIIRQPGGFTIIDADNSYCGRGNKFCTRFNRRGAAVMEVLFEHPDDHGGDDNVAPHDAVAAPSLTVHGYRADGTPFEFDVYSDWRVGRYVGDGWWVRLPPEATAATSSSFRGNEAAHAGLYELRRTQDGFRHEETRWATAAEVDAWLRQVAASGKATVPGELAPRHTKEELAEVRAHRLKTKVKRT